MARFSTVAAAVKAARAQNISWIANGGSKIQQKYGSLINRYRGAVPAALGAVRIWSESRGNVGVAPKSTTEVGLLQVWDHQAKTYGISNKRDAAQNLFAGFGWWNAVGRRLKQLHGFSSPDSDFWLVTYVALNIGRPAVSLILNHSKKEFGIEPSYRALEKFVEHYGEGMSRFKSWYGTQSHTLIAWRIIGAKSWLEGAQRIGPVNSTSFGYVYGKWGSYYPEPSEASGGLTSLAVMGGAAYLAYRLAKRYL